MKLQDYLEESIISFLHRQSVNRDRFIYYQITTAKVKMKKGENIINVYPMHPSINPWQAPNAEFSAYSTGNPVRTNRMLNKQGLHDKIFQPQRPITCQLLAYTIILLLGVGIATFFMIYVGTLLGFFATLIPLYLFYLCLTCCNFSLSRMKHIQKAQNFEKDFMFIKSAPGQILLQAECYHQTVIYDSQDPTPTIKKVVTRSETIRLPIFEKQDQTQPTAPLQGEPKLTLVRYFIDYQFMDYASEMKFRPNEQGIKARNNVDAHQSYDAFYDFPGRFEAKIYHTGQMTWKYNVGFYVSCILGLALPYVSCLDLSMRQLEIRIKKSVRI